MIISKPLMDIGLKLENDIRDTYFEGNLNAALWKYGYFLSEFLYIGPQMIEEMQHSLLRAIGDEFPHV